VYLIVIRQDFVGILLEDEGIVFSVIQYLDFVAVLERQQRVLVPVARFKGPLAIRVASTGGSAGTKKSASISSGSRGGLLGLRG